MWSSGLMVQLASSHSRLEGRNLVLKWISSGTGELNANLILLDSSEKKYHPNGQCGQNDVKQEKKE